MRIRKTQIQLDEFVSDDTISPDDKIIGSNESKLTKNYKAQDIAVYVRGGVGTAGQVLTSNGDGTWSFQ